MTSQDLEQLEKEALNINVNMWESGQFPQDLDHAKDVLLNYSKRKYLSLTDRMNLDENDKELFSWLVGGIRFHYILVSDLRFKAMTEILIEKSDEDEIVFHDCIDITSKYSLSILRGSEKKKYLLSEGCIEGVSIEDLIPFTVEENSIAIKDLIPRWVEKEFRQVDQLIAPSIESINFNQAIVRSKKYDLDSMFEIINNPQFVAELQECIYSYEHGKWFVCAAGLGGVLEHLLYLILEKNNMLDRSFPDNATYHDYVSYMAKEPISIPKREKTMIKNIFNIRNSVSHFNQGFTSKDQCTYLMNGIKDIFNNYYVKEFSIDDN